MRDAKTPFLHDEGNHGPSRNPSKIKGATCEWCAYVTPDVVPGAGSTVGGAGATSSSKVQETPGEVNSLGDDEVRGQLADAAASVLMKILYAARMARFDLLRPV